MVHSDSVVLSLYAARFPIMALSIFNGSLHLYGALKMYGSLAGLGTLREVGSLLLRGTLV